MRPTGVSAVSAGQAPPERVGGLERSGDELVERDALRRAQTHVALDLTHRPPRAASHTALHPDGGVAIGDHSYAGDGRPRNPASAPRRVAGITSPAGPFRRTDGRQRSDDEAHGHRRPRRLPLYRIRHPLRGRPTVHPVGCSSSCLSIRSMPSRMKDEAFRYCVYGANH
jgi:hypothetical protein